MARKEARIDSPLSPRRDKRSVVPHSFSNFICREARAPPYQNTVQIRIPGGGAQSAHRPGDAKANSTMKIKTSYLVAGGFLGSVVLLFVISGLISSFGGGEDKARAAAKAKEEAKPAAPLVTTATIVAQMRPAAIILRGRTEAARTVIVRAETAGPVSATPAAEGSFVQKGAVLCRLSVDARQATLDQARASLRSRQLQREASARLAEQGFRSQTQVLQDQANLDAAQAAVRQAEVALEQVNVRAPFSGVFDRRDAEVGTYLSPGGACGTLIELDPLVVVADLAENQIGQVAVGDNAQAVLNSGETLSGRVRLVARDADPQTRTYRVEVVARNPGARARSGLSADIRISTGVIPAHQIPSSALVLGSDGKQGVRYLDNAARVAFAPVTIIDETPEGIWVTGLAGTVQLITVGQSYVTEGQSVRAKKSAGGQ
jgi:multidrug efflux system membrane fusion protein